MLLTIDIGNSNITLGGFEGDELSFIVRISSELKRTSDEYAGRILSVFSVHSIDKSNISGAIISSVVPPLNSVVRDAVKLIWGIDSLIVGPGLKTGINIHCDNPSSVGADLICACVASHSVYGSPSLVVDLGTATKMTVVGEKGTFKGVSIIPGVMMGLNSLSENTAQLPRVELEPPKSVIGKNTVDCMRSGVIFGNASLIDGMIDRINDEVGAELPVYATGGLSHLIIPYCRHNIIIDDYLVLKGLNIIYSKNKKA
ncbi:MAG: type III pantothenate kinase [Clostridia bacterium]|nr:type III pantothenate kinase [Clostridia bacterium]